MFFREFLLRVAFYNTMYQELSALSLHYSSVFAGEMCGVESYLDIYGEKVRKCLAYEPVKSVLM